MALPASEPGDLLFLAAAQVGDPPGEVRQIERIWRIEGYFGLQDGHVRAATSTSGNGGGPIFTEERPFAQLRLLGIRGIRLPRGRGCAPSRHVLREQIGTFQAQTGRKAVVTKLSIDEPFLSW